MTIYVVAGSHDTAVSHAADFDPEAKPLTVTQALRVLRGQERPLVYLCATAWTEPAPADVTRLYTVLEERRARLRYLSCSNGYPR